MYFWSATRLPTTAVVWHAEGAVTSITAIAKATFAIEIGDADLAQVQEPIATFADAKPTAPSDLAPFKARADVLLVGAPFPPRGGAPFRCRVAVGTVDVTVEVGPRSPPQPLAVLGPRPPDPARGVSRWNVAPPAQQVDALPDEIHLTLENLSALGPVVQMSLPVLHLSVYAEGGGVTGTHPMRADTLWIDTDRPIACITYRATLSPRDDSEIRATILADHPAVQQDPAGLVLLELDDPSSDAGDEEPPAETGLLRVPSLEGPVAERPLSRDGLPFRPATPGSPGLALTPPPARAPAPTNDDDDAPATIPPPPLTPIPAGALGVPLLAPPLAPPFAPPLAPPFAFPPAVVALAPPPPMTPQAPVPARVPAPVTFATPAVVPPAHVPAPAPYVPGPMHRVEAPAPERLSHDAGAVRSGLAGASDAAARAAGAPPRARTRHRAEVERPRPTSNDICDLLWIEPTLAARVRRTVEWAPAVRDHAIDRGWLGADETFEESQIAADRRVVMRALARVTPAEVSTLPRLLAESIDDDGFVARQLLVVAGELSLPPDPQDVLKTSIEIAKPFATVDDEKPGTPTSRLKAAIDASGEARGAGVEAAVTRIRQAFAGLAKGLPTDYLEKTVDLTLLDERRHRVRELFGGDHVWGQIQAGTGTPTTVYIAEEAATLLPMASRFRVRMIVEPHPLQNRADGEGPVLRALAVARVIAQRSR